MDLLEKELVQEPTLSEEEAEAYERAEAETREILENLGMDPEHYVKWIDVI